MYTTKFDDDAEDQNTSFILQAQKEPELSVNISGYYSTMHMNTETVLTIDQRILVTLCHHMAISCLIETFGFFCTLISK